MKKTKKEKPKSKRVLKKEKLDSLFNFVENYKPAVIDYESKKRNAKNNFIQIVSKETTCLRPDIYLDYDRFCDACPLSEYCNCTIKKFSKKWNKK
jgi:hypothetical protein